MAVDSFTYTSGFVSSPFTPVEGEAFDAYPNIFGTGDMGPFRLDSGTLPDGFAFNPEGGHIIGVFSGRLRKKTVQISVSNGGVWYPTTVVFLGDWINHRSVVNISEREGNA